MRGLTDQELKKKHFRLTLKKILIDKILNNKTWKLILYQIFNGYFPHYKEFFNRVNYKIIYFISFPPEI